MSVTQLVELMKKKTTIAAINNQLSFARRSDNPTIVFTVGFEDSDPAVAARVANELVTRILHEDIKDRTNRASDTTKFLGREVERLQAAIDAKIAQAKGGQLAPSSTGKTDPLTQLKADYLQKSAIYSEKHPIMKALKRQIDAAEKMARPASSSSDDLASLQAQQDAIQKSLEAATAKYSAAQLGEALEKNQQSEKLEVLEQPAVPQEPIKPNRPKLLAMSFLLAFAAGGGLTVLLEFFDTTIRRTADIYGIVDSALVVQVPYIVTEIEKRRIQRRKKLLIVAAVLAVLVALVVAYFMVTQLDLIIAKARVGLFR
jgi:uncharacterized protein involved in exopolysaccharide biosynthesis